jgi:integrase
VNNRITSILCFLDNNDIELNRRMIRRYFPSDESTHDDRPYSRQEIQQILSDCDLCVKAIILLLARSGVRIESIHTMQIGDLIIVDFQYWNLYKVQVYARTRDKYFTFCTLVCYNAIQEYLNFRKRYGEELKDKSPLFRKHSNKLDPFTINAPKFLTEYHVRTRSPRMTRTVCMKPNAVRYYI